MLSKLRDPVSPDCRYIQPSFLLTRSTSLGLEGAVEREGGGKSPIREGAESHRTCRKAQKPLLQLKLPPQPRPPSQKVQGAPRLPRPLCGSA